MPVFRVPLSMLSLCLAVAGCSILPTPMRTAERDRLAAAAREALFANQEPVSPVLSLQEATARAVRYYADYRLRQMEEALAGAQLDVSRFDMLPRLTGSLGYTTRNNDAFGFGFSPNGTVATNPSASTERSHTTLNLGFSWNVLDFGVSYFKAKQAADQVLVSRERRRKARQILVHDVRQAWFRAEAAQRLLPEIDKLLADIEVALEKTRLIEARKLLPPAQIISLRRGLVELQQQISFRRQELAQAQVELAALVNVPPGTPMVLTEVPPEWRQKLDLTADITRLETYALQHRPDLTEEGYKTRISEAEAKKALLGLLPNLNFDFGTNYDSNRFLLNNHWSSAGLSIAYNLVRVFSIPASNRSAEAQRQVDEARRSAVAMAVLAQTRIAAVRYSLMAHEHGVWQEAARDDTQIVKLLETSARAGVDTELELIRARSRAMASNINRDLSFANLQGVVGQLYQSMGMDVVDDTDSKAGIAALSAVVDRRLADFRREVFTERAAPAPIPVAMGPVSGVEPVTGALLSQGMERIFNLSEVRMSAPEEARFRIAMRAVIEPPRRGAQAAQIEFRVLESGTGKEWFESEFKTTLSSPLDDEQVRVLGEAAAYRILVWLTGMRGAAAGALPPLPAKPVAEVPDLSRIAASLDGEPLSLRLSEALGPSARIPVSRLDIGEAVPTSAAVSEAVAGAVVQ